MPSLNSQPSTLNWRRTGWLFLGLGAVLGFGAYRLGAPLWSNFPDYNYGWAIPGLVVYLFWQRWKDRPMANPPVVHGWQVSVMGAVGVLLLPLVLVQEANLIWLTFAWLIGLWVVVCLLWLVWLAGGWSWVRHFGFVLGFLLLAIPWPGFLEGPFTGVLAKSNAACAVEAVNFFGIPALRRGTLIEVSGGTVGIDDACSGIRSFHAVLMLALLFGELYRLSILRRALCLAAGIGFAFVFNVVRTWVLVRVSAVQGFEALHRWHDPVGVAVLVACFGSLWLLARLLKRKPVPSAAPDLRPLISDHRPPTSDLCASVFLRRAVLALLAWQVIVEIAVEGWYRVHERGQAASIHWGAVAPSGARPIELSQAVRNNLKFNESSTVKWTEADGREWLLYYFRWLPAESRTARAWVQRAAGHHPTRCLTGSGMNLQKDGGIQCLTAGGVTFPMRRYVFSDRGRLVYVFHCVWHDGTPADGAKVLPGSERAIPRLASVLTGNRSMHRGIRALEIATSGYDSLEEAEGVLQRKLEELIKVEPGKSQ